MFGLVSKSKLEAVELEVKRVNTELQTTLSNLTAYQTAMYGWLNNGQPVQMADNSFTYIQDGYQFNADVYSCVDLILTKLSQCTPTVYAVTKDKVNQVQKYRNLLASNTHEARIKAKIIETKAMKETYFQPISDLLMSPNRLQSWTDWVKNYAGMYLLTGNTYNYYNSINPKTKKWGEMYVLPAQFIQIISGGDLAPIAGYRIINQRFFGSDIYDFSSDTVSHMKTFNPNYTNFGSQLYGQSPLSAYRLTLQKNRDGRIEANKQMKNGGAMGILSPQAGAPVLTPDQARDLKEQVASKHRSAGDLIERIFAAGAPLNWQQIGLAVSDLMLLESLDFDKKDICNAYHVPVILMNDMSAATDNNVAAHMKAFIYNVIIPLCNLISDRLTRDICTAYNTDAVKYVIQLDPTTLPDMSDDMQKVASWMAQSWWLTPNERRQGMGFETSKEPNTDKIIIPSMNMLIDDLSTTDSAFTQAGQTGDGF
jgi:HK97 family phage portal protein